MVKHLILGAGLTGLSAAFFLEQNYELAEKENQVGGQANTVEKNGFIFDYGEKFIRVPNAELEDFFIRLMGDNFFSQELKSAIFFKGKFITYPFQENLRELPPEELQTCAKSLLENFLANQNQPDVHINNFQDFINYQNGSYIAKEFMIPYNEKIWATSPKKMNTSWFLGKNVIPSLNLDDILKSILPQPEGSTIPKRIRWYPRHGGSKEISMALVSSLSNVQLNLAVKSINLEQKIVMFQDDSTETYENLVSTIPLNELLLAIEDLPPEIRNLYQALKYNTVFCLNLCLDYEHDWPYHWLYFPQKDVQFSRLFFSSNFSRNNAPPGQSSCSVILTYLPGTRFNQKAMENAIVSTLIKLGFITNESSIIDRIPLTIKYGFAIPTLGLPEVVGKIKGYLEMKDVYLLGRYGEWKYAGIEHAIEDGKSIARILKEKDDRS